MEDKRSDAGLIADYVESRSEKAFEKLVNRHADMVYARCVRELEGDTALAEEAAQAVFIVLARKAGSIRKRGSLSAWLFRIARNTVKNIKREESRRRARERKAVSMAEQRENNLQERELWEQVQPHLDAAIDSLPRRSREAAVLHWLEQRSRKETARLLGCTEKMVDDRIAYARTRTQAYLRKKSIVAPVGALTALLTAQTLQGAPAALKGACISAGVSHAAGALAGGAVSVTIAQGVIKMMMWTKIKVIAAVTCGVIITGVGTGVSVQAVMDFSSEALKIQTAVTQTAAAGPQEIGKPFVPKGGRIIAAIKAPHEHPNDIAKICGFKWKVDDTELRFDVCRSAPPRRRNSTPYVPRYDIYSLNVETSRVEKRFTDIRGLPKWVGFERIMTRPEPDTIVIYEPGGKKTKISLPLTDIHGLSSSPDGKFAAFRERKRGSGPFQNRIFVFPTAGGRIKEIRPPREKTDNPKLKLYTSMGSWTDEGKLQIWSCQRERLTMYGPWHMTRDLWDSWLYGPQAGEFRKLHKDPGYINVTLGTAWFHSGLDPSQYKGWIWSLSGGRSLRRISAETTPFSHVAGEKRLKAAPAAELEILDSRGKVIKRMHLDRKSLGNADLVPLQISADHRFMVASVFREITHDSGRGRSGPAVWRIKQEKTLLLDLATGNAIREINRKDLGRGQFAIMSPAKGIMSVSGNAIFFDGRTKTWTHKAGLPDSWRQDKIFYANGLRRMPPGCDRLAMLTRPKRHFYAAGERKLLVFWNSATPIQAWSFSSKGGSDRGRLADGGIQNVTWSSGNNLLAFTAQDILYIWKPTLEPGKSGPESESRDIF